MPDNLEPRVVLLERLHSENTATLKAVQSDIHHMTKTFDKMEQTLSKFAELSVKLDGTRETAIRAHKRIDDIEIQLRGTSSDFNSCRSSKLDRKDIDPLVQKVSHLEVMIARTAWVERVIWLIVAGALALYLG